MRWIVGDQEAGGTSQRTHPSTCISAWLWRRFPHLQRFVKDLSLLCGLPPSLELQKVVCIVCISHHSLLTQHKMPQELSEGVREKSILKHTLFCPNSKLVRVEILIE
jgi:hypothetical protein